MASSFETEWERPDFETVPSLAERMAYLLPGVNDITMRFALQETYRDFCRRSGALRTWRKIELEEGNAHYVVVPVLSGEIDCVTQVMSCVRQALPERLWRVAGDPPVLEFPHGWHCHEFMAPTKAVAFVQAKPNVGSMPVEVRAGGRTECSSWSIWVEAVEIPHIGEERAPRAFLRRYGDTIVDGALARLMSQTQKPWSDLEQARQHGIAYANALSEARLRTMRGGSAANAASAGVLDMSSMV